MKEDGCNRTVKNLNQYIPHHYFKTESLNSLRDILKQGNFMCKLDLKDAYFCIPLAEESKKFARLYWEGDLYQFLCLCFELAPAPLRFPQIIEDSNCLSLENSHFDHNLSRWYALSWKNSWECPDVSRYSGALVAGTAVFDKAKEVGSDTLIGGGTSRYGNKLYFNSHTNGQQSGFDVFEKNGGNQESENGYTVKRNLRHINFKTDHDYCGVPTQLINTVADLESRRKVDSSKWILGGHVFRNLCLKLGTWTVPQHLLVSRISHQVAQ